MITKVAYQVKKVLGPRLQGWNLHEFLGHKHIKKKRDNAKDSVISLDEIDQSDDDTTEGDNIDQQEPSRCSSRIISLQLYLILVLVQLETGVQIWSSAKHWY
eukprot:9479040-Ditylum_brightwellii.AAC.1